MTERLTRAECNVAIAALVLQVQGLPKASDLNARSKAAALKLMQIREELPNE